MIYLTNLNLNQNELQNAIIQPLAVAPANPKFGQIYCDSTDARIKFYNGTAWQIVGMIVESSEANGSIKVDGVEMKVYELPAATADTLGGIKVGAGLKVLADGTLSVDVIDNLTSEDATKALSAKQGKVLSDAIAQLSGVQADDMMKKSEYDIDKDGIVDHAAKSDDADKLGGQLPSHYATAQSVADLTQTVNNNETDIENKFSTLSQTVADNETDIENKFSTLSQTVADNEADIEEKVANLATLVGENETDIEKKVADLTTEVGKKVDKVEGKQLSTEDFTTAEKQKLAGIAEGAEVNVQADWSVSDAESDAFIKNKPTALSQFTNDEGFIDNTVANLVNYYTKNETFNKEEINTKFAQLATIQIVVPEGGALPTTGKFNEIYLIPKDSAQESNSYDEYIWTGSAFEKIGDTKIDLSSYLTKTGDASATTVAFTAAGERALPTTGESQAIILGKIVKYLADLKAVAFSGSYNDLTDKPTLVKEVHEAMDASATTKTITVDGTRVISVMLTDATTHEALIADVTINGATVTVKTSAAYANGIDILVAYM